jgi:C1A family cysteine protease
MPVNDVDNRLSLSHAVTIVGNRPDLNSWIIANSRGLKWGDKGFGILPYNCVVDIGEAFSITGLLDTGIGKNF